jgi:hypothetical protein
LFFVRCYRNPDSYAAFGTAAQRVPSLGGQMVPDDATVARRPNTGAMKKLFKMLLLGLVRKFDHGIFYRIHGTRIVVTAVLDLRKDPTTIRRRLNL